MKPSEALAAHRDELRRLVSSNDLTHPRIFGSVLTGSDTKESDLDLLVDPSSSTTLFTLARLEYQAEALPKLCASALTPGVLIDKIPRAVTGTGSNAMKHPERAEEYLGLLCRL